MKLITLVSTEGETVVFNPDYFVSISKKKDVQYVLVNLTNKSFYVDANISDVQQLLVNSGE